MRTVFYLSAIACVFAGCSDVKPAANARDTMSQRQRDSVLAGSILPGAQGVGRAMRASDAADRRNAGLESASRE